MKTLNVAIVGATGLVGQTILQVLAERRLPINRLRLLATTKSAGTKLEYLGETIDVEVARPQAFAGVDLAFFAVGTEASKVLVPHAVDRGAVAIDKSNAYRLAPEVPLVVPEVNGAALATHRGIVASPNCTTIQCVVALAPLARAAGLARVYISTYQAVSGSGRGGVDELTSQLAAIANNKRPTIDYYPRQIAGNVIPYIDGFDATGYTGEERKMVAETRKILELPQLPVAATAARVPVAVGHAVTMFVETERPLTREQAQSLLAQAPGIRLVDDPASGQYPTPLDAAGQDLVLIGRVREAKAMANTLEMWVVADNLRKGAATNAVQIAERLVSQSIDKG